MPDTPYKPKRPDVEGIEARVADNWCHPTHAQRTKCACGRVISLAGAFGGTLAVCSCGRRHSKRPGSAFEPGYMMGEHGGLSTGKRKGGRGGCPGVILKALETEGAQRKDEAGDAI